MQKFTCPHKFNPDFQARCPAIADVSTKVVSASNNKHIAVYQAGKINTTKLTDALSDTKNIPEVRLSLTHHQLSNASLLVSVLATTPQNFTNHLNQVWWPGLDPAVTSLPLQLSPHPDVKKYFKCQIWVLLAIGFPTRHRSSLHDKYSSWNCLMFAWGALFPMSS